MNWLKTLAMGMTDALLACIFCAVWLLVVWTADALIRYWSMAL